MIELNLLPENLRVVKKKKPAVKIDLPKVPMFPLIVGVASAIVLAHLILGFMGIDQKKRLLRLGTELSQMAPQEEMAAALKKEAEELGRRIDAVDSLYSSSLIWSKKLYDLNHAMTTGIWLTCLYLNEEVPAKNSLALNLTGILR